jgi:hypothetical protein
MDQRTHRIRELNNQFRKSIARGMYVMSPGISDLGEEAVDRIVKTVAALEVVYPTDHPHEEHALGTFEAEGRTMVFKIFYFDTDLEHQSPDPADPAATVRVMEVMLDHEYWFLLPTFRSRLSACEPS